MVEILLEIQIEHTIGIRMCDLAEYVYCILQALCMFLSS